MTDERPFKPVETSFEDTWPNYSWAPLLRLVFACAERVQGWRRARHDWEVGFSESDPASRLSA
jgi:hypothetical protein